MRFLTGLSACLCRPCLEARPVSFLGATLGQRQAGPTRFRSSSLTSHHRISLLSCALPLLSRLLSSLLSSLRARARPRRARRSSAEPLASTARPRTTAGPTPTATPPASPMASAARPSPSASLARLTRPQRLQHRLRVPLRLLPHDQAQLPRRPDGVHGLLRYVRRLVVRARADSPSGPAQSWTLTACATTNDCEPTTISNAYDACETGLCTVRACSLVLRPC